MVGIMGGAGGSGGGGSRGQWVYNSFKYSEMHKQMVAVVVE